MKIGESGMKKDLMKDIAISIGLTALATILAVFFTISGIYFMLF